MTSEESHIQNFSDWVTIGQIVPQGVLCLLTAALHYELTTFVPSEYEIALPRHAKRPIFVYPPLHILYWSENPYLLGQTYAEINGCRVRIYDREKTVCDVWKYRNKIGEDKAKEVIKNYLKSPTRRITRLMDYAKKMRVATHISQYIEILV